jgi:hypothetical protein
MNRYSKWMLGLFVFGLIALPSSLGYAGHGSQSCRGGGHGWGMSEKFFHKAHFILDNQEAIGVTEEQKMDIKSQKRETRKLLISRGAEIDIIKIDLKAAMHDFPVDEEALVNLVEEKYRIKKALARDLAVAYAKLRNTLTEEQNNGMKEVWRSLSSK